MAELLKGINIRFNLIRYGSSHAAETKHWVKKCQ